jgi:hypothetical protein
MTVASMIPLHEFNMGRHLAALIKADKLKLVSADKLVMFRLTRVQKDDKTNVP